MKKEYEIHELCLFFPYMEDGIFEALKKDIEKFGQRDTIKIYKGKVIDGKNRLKAIEELGREPFTETLPDDTNIIAYVKALGLHRRDLSPTQRIIISQQLEQYRLEMENIADKVEDIKKDPTQKMIYERAEMKRIAKEANSNVPTVKKVLRIKEEYENNKIDDKTYDDLLKGKGNESIDKVYKKTKPRKINPKKTPVEVYEESKDDIIQELKKELSLKNQEIAYLNELLEKMIKKFVELDVWNKFRYEIFPISKKEKVDIYPSIKQLREAYE